MIQDLLVNDALGLKKLAATLFETLPVKSSWKNFFFNSNLTDVYSSGFQLSISQRWLMW